MYIDDDITIPDSEITISAVRSDGPGGQNVNKVATAVQLKFDIAASSLPGDIRERLLSRRDRRITHGGILIIKARRYRTQERNKDDAMDRLREIILRAAKRERTRTETKPSTAARRRRLDEKKKRSRQKELRRRVDF